MLELLTVALLAILCGADSFVGIETWGKAKRSWLQERLSLRHGIASHDTFGRLLVARDPQKFEACFIRWVSGICLVLTGQVVAIDGKTVRGSRQRGVRAIHRVSAFSGSLGIVLGPTRSADHSNEITAITALLDMLMLKGAIITIDAMGCQQAMAQKIVDGEADYVLAVKGNQTELHLFSRLSGHGVQQRPRVGHACVIGRTRPGRRA